MEAQYDVIIPGGGLAGLTLAIQLKLAKPEISILILESRETEATTAAHKVGESTVELATHYMREVLGLKDYLEEHELPKHGLRFFFKTENKGEIENRVELGPRLKLPVPSHQLDRGTLENHLAKRAKELGSVLVLGARAREVNFSDNGHEVVYSKEGQDVKVTGRWVADATGRGSLLKRKLKFQKPMEHHANAVWWRLKGVIDIDTWSDNDAWKNHLEPNLRYLSTVHFMDNGYWVWIIPLGSKNTSIGIVADPAIHPFEEINTYEKSLNWLEKNEPLCYKMLKPLGEGDGLMDFRVLKHYAHDSGRLYSADRWGVTGESGAFLDPLYSPGSDFISLANTWLSDLILRDLDGENISMRAEIYEKAHLSHVENWIPIYQDKYTLMGNTQIMVMKIFWDWAVYWAIPSLMFTNKAFTDLKILKELFVPENGLGRKYGKLNKVMQDFFLEWRPYDTEIFTNHYIDPFDVAYLQDFQKGIEVQHGSNLVQQLTKNLETLEKVAATIFRLVSSHVKGTPSDMPVNPYDITLGTDDLSKHANGILPEESITKDIDVMWFYNKKAAGMN
ncbi:MAG: NAD(P)/FAD-dependent oxidoreductase [Bacteroidota bacterium]